MSGGDIRPYVWARLFGMIAAFIVTFGGLAVVGYFVLNLVFG